MSDPKEILEQRLDRAVEDRDTRGLHLFCQIGGRYLDEGMTTLQVNGSGWTLVGWRNEEDRQLYSVELSWPDREKLFRVLRKHPFWEASPARRDREGDEKNVHLRFSDRDAGTYSALHFWDTEMETFPVLHRLMDHVTDLVQSVSEGEVPLILGSSLEEYEPTQSRRAR